MLNTPRSTAVQETEKSSLNFIAPQIKIAYKSKKKFCRNQFHSVTLQFLIKMNKQSYASLLIRSAILSQLIVFSASENMGEYNIC